MNAAPQQCSGVEVTQDDRDLLVSLSDWLFEITGGAVRIVATDDTFAPLKMLARHRSTPTAPEKMVPALAGWQDIATAPKDGSWIITAGGGADFGMPMKWCASVGAWECDACMLEDWDDQAEGYSRPTHWMPLPAAPGAVPSDQTLTAHAQALHDAGPLIMTAEEFNRICAKINARAKCREIMG